MEKTKLSKYFFYLFVASIILVVTNALTNASDDDGSILKTLVSIINLATSIFYIVIILKLSKLSSHYKTSAILKIVNYALVVVSTIIGVWMIFSSFFSFGHHMSIEGIIGLTLGSFSMIVVILIIIAIASSIIGMIAEYHEYQGHSEAMIDYDSSYTVKWKKLWKYYFWSMIIMIIAMAISLISVFTYSFGLVSLGMAITLIAGIAGVACGIFKIIYLYRMSKIVENYDDTYIDVEVHETPKDDNTEVL